MDPFLMYIGKTEYHPNEIAFTVFNFDDVPDIYVSKYKDGIFTIDVPAGVVIDALLIFVEAIFRPTSNFIPAVCKAFNVPEKDFKGVSFDFNGIPFLVTRENADAKQLLKYWNKEIKKKIKFGFFH